MIGNVPQRAQEPLCDHFWDSHEQDTTSEGAGPQIGPEGPMESLAGLRAYVERHARMDEMTKAALQVYAREIEREVEEERTAAYNEGYDEGFASADDWAAQHEDAMAEHGWVKLPVDADGKPIHVGDWITGDWDAKAKVVAITSEDVYWWEPDGCHWCHAYEVRHHHAPTVEDVLEEFVARWMETHHDDIPALKAEFAAKLRLAGDE